MAHQASAIPWNVLSSHLQYKRASGRYEIWALDQPGQTKALIHFVKAFTQTLREYARVERQKYASAKHYAARAATWQKSDQTPDIVPREAPPLNSRPRCQQEETRKVFSDLDRQLWKAQEVVSMTDDERAQLQYVENWFPPSEDWLDLRPVEQYRDKEAWYRIRNDTIKAMMMEIALATTPFHARQSRRDLEERPDRRHAETLLLLAHHPNVVFNKWDPRGWCDQCWTTCGPESLVTSALTAYIYLNLLYSMRESGSKVCEMTDEYVGSQCKAARFSKVLLPRAKYMNTSSWRAVLNTVFKHANSEEIMFEAFLFPQKETNFSVVELGEQNPGRASRRFRSSEDFIGQEEVDIMSMSPDAKNEGSDPLSTRGSASALRETLRALWKILVVHEMLWADMGSPPDWETLICEHIDILFQGVQRKRRSLFFDNDDDYDEHRYRGIFNGSFKPSDGIGTTMQSSQKGRQRERNRMCRREGRRQARAQDKAAAGSMSSKA